MDHIVVDLLNPLIFSGQIRCTCIVLYVGLFVICTRTWPNDLAMCWDKILIRTIYTQPSSATYDDFADAREWPWSWSSDFFSPSLATPWVYCASRDQSFANLNDQWLQFARELLCELSNGVGNIESDARAPQWRIYRGAEPAPPPPFGRQTDAVTVLLISQHGGVLWRRHRQLTYKQVTVTHCHQITLF